MQIPKSLSHLLIMNLNPALLVVITKLADLIRLFHYFFEDVVFLYFLFSLCSVILTELVALCVAVLTQSHLLHRLL